MIKLKATDVAPQFDELLQRMTGPRWQALMQSFALDLSQSGKREMRRRGDPAGDWPKLSGYGENTGSMEYADAKQRIEDIKQGYGTKADLANLNDYRKRLRSTVQHSKYARRKAEGKTPGRGKYGPGVRLRDTGALIDSITGIVVEEDGKTIIRLIAEGPHHSGMTAQELLEIHVYGKGNTPKRSPVEDMSFFEKKTTDRLAEFVSAASRRGR